MPCNTRPCGTCAQLYRTEEVAEVVATRAPPHPEVSKLKGSLGQLQASAAADGQGGHSAE
jgi:hypothetical protein